MLEQTLERIELRLAALEERLEDQRRVLRQLPAVVRKLYLDGVSLPPEFELRARRFDLDRDVSPLPLAEPEETERGAGDVTMDYQAEVVQSTRAITGGFAWHLGNLAVALRDFLRHGRS